MFLNLARKRLSCRSYLEQPVPRELLDYCLEAARLAPSACNQQPWRFIVVSDPELRKQIADRALLPGLPMPWLQVAPVIVVLCAKKSPVTHIAAPLFSGIHYHLLDIGIAGEHFVLAAAEKGLGTCWIGWVKTKTTAKILGLSGSLKPIALIPVGYPAVSAEPRERLPLSDIADFR